MLRRRKSSDVSAKFREEVDALLRQDRELLTRLANDDGERKQPEHLAD